MAVRIAITSNQPQVAKLFRTLQQLGANLEPLLDDIAQEGENSTRRRFRDQVGPDGQRWKQSLRAQITGTKTLTKDGHLGNTITKSVDQHTAAWGTNRIYAAIHQFGGVIRAKSAAGLRFKIPGFGWVTKRQVTIVARPFLGVSADDQRDMLELASQHISKLINRSVPGGA